MKTNLTQSGLLPLVFLISLFFLVTCEKEADLSEMDFTASTELQKKKSSCPSPSVDVIGTAAKKSDAKKDFEKRAHNACYNLCKNSACTDGACSYKKFKSGKTTESKNADNEYVIRGKVTCECDCDDCKGKKTVSLNAFVGKSETEEGAVAEALKEANNYCKTIECPRYPCDEEEQCIFEEAKTSKPVTDGKDGIWTARLELITCDCNCEDAELPPDGSN